MSIIVKRKSIKFSPDASRVITRFLFTTEKRAKLTIKSVMSMSEKDVLQILNPILRDFSLRHRNISKIFEKHFNKISYLLTKSKIELESVSLSRKMLIGSYFTMEYSIESAAFFNPSIVEHPDQSEISFLERRVILSFRATGEGHISSIVFRTGIIDKNNTLTLEPVGNLLGEAELIRRHIYDKESFKSKLAEMNFYPAIPVEMILSKLHERFTYGELKECLDDAKILLQLTSDKEPLFNEIMWLASSHYELEFSLDTNISERVIFPVSTNEKNGIEDARFVKFIDENNEVTYYATYTAYDGTSILPKMLDTKDFYHFKIIPIHGEIAQNKGMALFPRKVNGKYAMLCRLDGFNNYIAFSDKISVWRKAQLLMKPKYPWEFIQVGNNGSPIETSDGWLVITHGVGPMREYTLGAILLDLDDPTKIIGRLKTPLLMPNAEEREGYVPNVVYSCGSMVHDKDLIIPYAMSDSISTYATVNLKELLDELKASS